MENIKPVEVETEKSESVLEQDRLELAARVFKQYTKDFRRLINSFSSNQLRRFAINLVEYPLSEQPIRLPTVTERQAHQMATDILNAKSLIFQSHKEQEKRDATLKLMEQNKGLIDQSFFDNVEQSRTAFVKSVEAFNEQLKLVKEQKKEETNE